MKLLLTSEGLANTSITKALEKLLGKSPKGVRVAYIPTASNVEEGDKHWLIDDYMNFRNAGYTVDIVDISAVPKKIWLPKLQAAEVLCFGGGNTFHLMHWLKKSGLQLLLSELLQSKIYVGISAGSCVTGKTIYNSVQNLFGETYELKIKHGLGLVDFQTIPHLNSTYFTNIRTVNVEKSAKSITDTVYAIDDNSAVVVDDQTIKVVSEGTWARYN